MFGKQPEEHRMDLRLGRRSDPKNDDARVSRRRIAQYVSKVLVVGNEDHRALNGEAQQLGIRSVLWSHVLQANDFKA